MTIATSHATAPETGPIRHQRTSPDGGVVQWTEFGRGFPVVICSPPAVPFSYWQPTLTTLADRSRFYFVHPRALWDGYMPEDLREVTVEDHARDLTLVIDTLALDRYAILAHCAGVTPVVAGLPRLARPPLRMLLVSTRFSRGVPIDNLERVLDRIRTDPRFRAQYMKVVSAYAPPTIRGFLEQELADVRKLEAQLHAVQSTRLYAFDDPLPSDVTVLLARSQDDFLSIRDTVEAYGRRLGDRCLGVVDLAGGHCALQEDVEAGKRLLIQAFGDLWEEESRP